MEVDKLKSMLPEECGDSSRNIRIASAGAIVGSYNVRDLIPGTAVGIERQAFIVIVLNRDDAAGPQRCEEREEEFLRIGNKRDDPTDKNKIEVL